MRPILSIAFKLIWQIMLNKNSFLPLCIRGATLASKFLLITYLAKYASFDILAQYSLITITVSYLLYFLGFDFYTFSSREILKETFRKSSQMLTNQFYFYSVMYVLSIPLIAVLPSYDIVDTKIIVLFYFVLITEHISQEFMRILVINENAFKANIQLFIRTALWIYIYIIYSFIIKDIRIDILLIMWLSANIIALFFSIREMKYVDWKRENTWSVDYLWIYKGIKIAIPLLLATLMLRGVYFSDRYFLKFLSSTDDLAVYSFFSNMANALIAFIDAAVIMYFYPQLINAYNKKDKNMYVEKLRLFKRKIIIVGCGVGAGLSLMIPSLCVFLNRMEFLDRILIFYILLLSSFVYCYGLIYHYELYARDKDSIIFLCTLVSFIIGVVAQYYLAKEFQSIGVAFGVLLSSLLLLSSKAYFACKVKEIA